MRDLVHSDAKGVVIPGELVARLEAASVGSRELDGLLARQFGWHRIEPRHARNKAGGWIAPEDFLGLHGDGSPRFDSLHGTDIHRDPPRLSQSLDAALALAERVLPGWGVYLRSDADGQGAGLTYAKHSYVTPGHVEHKSSLPLALCIAILRAVAAQPDDTQPGIAKGDEPSISHNPIDGEEA